MNSLCLYVCLCVNYLSLNDVLHDYTELQAELQAAREQIADMQRSIESVVQSKDAVEQGVKSVLEENDSLSARLAAATARIAALEAELQGLPWGTRWEASTAPVPVSTPNRPNAVPVAVAVPKTAGLSLPLSSTASSSLPALGRVSLSNSTASTTSASVGAPKRVSFSDVRPVVAVMATDLMPQTK